MNLLEGGNVFKDSEGKAICQRINQTDIKPTVVWLEHLTGLDLRGEPDENGIPEKWLGSTGRKPSSGDLDLEVDANEVQKEALYNLLAEWAKSYKQEPKDWVAKTGSIVHFKTPINGNPKNGYVQTDFTFLNKPSWSLYFKVFLRLFLRITQGFYETINLIKLLALQIVLQIKSSATIQTKWHKYC